MYMWLYRGPTQQVHSRLRCLAQPLCKLVKPWKLNNFDSKIRKQLSCQSHYLIQVKLRFASSSVAYFFGQLSILSSGISAAGDARSKRLWWLLSLSRLQWEARLTVYILQAWSILHCKAGARHPDDRHDTKEDGQPSQEYPVAGPGFELQDLDFETEVEGGQLNLQQKRCSRQDDFQLAEKESSYTQNNEVGRTECLNLEETLPFASLAA